MDQQELQALKTKLTAQREELKKLLGRFASKDAHIRDDFHALFPNYGTDEESNASEVSDYEDELGIEKDLNKALQEVDVALDAIEKGSYGICRVCSKTIEKERLAVVPSADLCIAHKDSKS